MESPIKLRSVTSLFEHPSAGEIFEMTPAEWSAFLEDVGVKGVEEPLVVCGSIVVDGRHRLRAAIACEQQTVPVRQVKMTEVEQLDYMIRHAKNRRHLTVAQLAILAVKLKPKYEEAAKERLHKGQQSGGRGNKKNSVEINPPSLDSGKSRDQAAAAVGVSGRTVADAEIVLQKGTPELVTAMETGAVGVQTAARVARKPPEEQREFLQNPVGRNTMSKNELKEEVNKEPGERRGKGVILANEAINCLMRIPKNDALRNRGFQLVTDWIRKHKE